MTRLPLPRPDGVVRLYVNDGFKDVWTAPSMHAYSDACNAALREDAERWRWLRREQVALSLPSSTVAALVADQSELDAAMETPE